MMSRSSTSILAGSNNSGGKGGRGGPCGACKFLRRKCVRGCIFAPYFDSDQGTANFAAVHKVFGASNASKLLMAIAPHKRLDTVVTLCYEALARVKDPVYGCGGHIFTLQQQVVNLQAELAYVRARLSTLQQRRLPLSDHSSLHQLHGLISRPPTALSHVPSNPISDHNRVAYVSANSDQFTSIPSSTASNMLMPFHPDLIPTAVYDDRDHEQQMTSILINPIFDDHQGCKGSTDLQALAREFVSRCLSQGVKYDPSS